jgi:hypothetical protein
MIDLFETGKSMITEDSREVTVKKNGIVYKGKTAEGRDIEVVDNLNGQSHFGIQSEDKKTTAWFYKDKNGKVQKNHHSSLKINF